MSTDIEKRVEEAIEAIKPAVQMDGGDVELISVEGDVAVVRMMGACSCCSMAQVTLKQGIEQVVRQAVPEIKRVDAVFN
jgi:Fe-S cluster biogenesis protein NfuA